MSQTPPASGIDYTGSPDSPSNRKRVSGWLVGSIIVAVAMVLVPLVLGIRWVSPKLDVTGAAGALDSDLKKAKAAGVPLVTSDLAPVTAVKPSENAAPLIMKLPNDEQETRATDALLTPVYEDLEERDYKAAQAAIDDSRIGPDLKLAKEAAALPKCDFHLDYDLGPNLIFPELAATKHFVKFLSARAEAEAGQGNNAAALSDLQAAYRLGRDGGSDASLISLLVWIACDEIVLASTERCLATAKTPADVQSYAAFLHAPRPQFDNLRALRGEAYMGIASIRNLPLFSRMLKADQEVVPADVSKIQRSGVPSSLMARAYLARHLEIWSQILSAIQPVKDDPEQTFKRVAQITKEVEAKPGVSYTLEKILVPVFDQIGNVELRDEAGWNNQKALSKVLLYRAQHGSFPDSLDEAGASEIDPFTGQPLKYVKIAGGVKIYSVGEDRQDNGGIRRTEIPARDRALGREKWDEVASYPPPVWQLPPARPAPFKSPKPATRRP